MKQGIREPGPTEITMRLMREHPLRFPIALLCVGAFGVVWTVWSGSHGGVIPLVLGGLGVVLLLAGLVLLPFGLAISVRRHRDVQVLRCPRCGSESRSADRPFRVDYPQGVDYAYVVCSNCGSDFTVDKYARLA